MPRLLAAIRRLATSWRGDVVPSFLMLGWSVGFIAVQAAHGHQHWAALAFVVAYSAAVGVRTKWPFAAAVLACAALLTVRPLGQASLVNGSLTVPFAWTPFLLSYAVGARTGLVLGLACVVALTTSLEITNVVFNPLLLMIAFGPWLAGRIAASRRTMTGQLRARNAELAAEQELFAQESVRYERARIARELHDIVGHCLSVIVVQASAGQRGNAAEAFESVAEAATQAREEIGRLVELLGGDDAPDLGMVGELVKRAVSAGLNVTCRISDDCRKLDAVASRAAYRVVQEALTNALKHAPGAPVTISVGAAGKHIAVRVENLCIENLVPSTATGLALSGGQFGLAAMRERVSACGGSLSVGPTQDGRWRVLALLPANRRSAA